MESPNLGIFSSMTPQARAETIAVRLSALELHPVTKILRQIFGLQSGAASELYHVGGSVRDALLAKPISDLDFSCALAPAEILARLNALNVRALEMSAKHGTIIAVFSGVSYEITQFRDAARTCAGDLALRDFTINALAFPVVSNLSQAQLYDPQAGLHDLENSILRACGNDATARFTEDPLRILRAIRFGPAQNFELQADTAAAATANAKLLLRISPERIRDELEKILLSANPRAAFRVLRDLKVLDVILPEVLPSIGSEQNEWHVEDVFEHTLTVISRANLERIQRWCALFHDLGKPATTTVDEQGRRHFFGHEKVSETLAQQVMQRLRFSTDDQRLISLLVRQHMRPINLGEAGVRRLLRDLGAAYQEWRAFKWADAPPALDEALVKLELAAFDKMVETEFLRPKGSVYSALAVDGNMLVALGFAPGPKLGGALKMLHEVVLEDPEKNERTILLNLAREILKGP